MVPQETVLFSGTIYDNLIIANPHATFEQVIQACRWAEIHDTIEQLPEGYQTGSASTAPACRADRSSASPLRGRCSSGRRSSSSTKPPAISTSPTAEQFARTINQLKGKVTMLYITHQLPQGLEVDEVVTLGAKEA